jgi:proline racemase
MQHGPATRVIDVVYTHTIGEPTCIVTSGIIYPGGMDILAKRRFLEDNYDWVRQALMQEPRGHKDMYGVFLTPAETPEADAGTIWMSGKGFMHTCGHGTIGLSIALVSMGLKPAEGVITTLNFETTAGPVKAEVKVENGKPEWCRYTNVPTFVVEDGVEFELPDHGQVTADLIFCGNFFGIVDWRKSNLKVCPENASRFAALGLQVRDILNDRVRVKHPLYPHINEIETITFYQDPTNPNARYRSTHVFGDGQLDRSPGGAATAAMLAMFEHRNELAIGETLQAEGLLGAGTFTGCLVGETDVAGHRAVITTVQGTARVTGSARWVIDPDDEVGRGFIVS